MRNSKESSAILTFESNEDSLKNYKGRHGGYEASPSLVVKPHSEDDISKIVKIARRWHVPVMPRGAGTSLTGVVVLKSAIILDTVNFNQVDI